MLNVLIAPSNGEDVFSIGNREGGKEEIVGGYAVEDSVVFLCCVFCFGRILTLNWERAYFPCWQSCHAPRHSLFLRPLHGEKLFIWSGGNISRTTFIVRLRHVCVGKLGQTLVKKRHDHPGISLVCNSSRAG